MYHSNLQQSAAGVHMHGGRAQDCEQLGLASCVGSVESGGYSRLSCWIPCTCALHAHALCISTSAWCAQSQHSLHHYCPYRVTDGQQLLHRSHAPTCWLALRCLPAGPAVAASVPGPHCSTAAGWAVLTPCTPAGHAPALLTSCAGCRHRMPVHAGNTRWVTRVLGGCKPAGMT